MNIFNIVHSSHCIPRQTRSFSWRYIVYVETKFHEQTVHALDGSGGGAAICGITIDLNFALRAAISSSCFS